MKNDSRNFIVKFLLFWYNQFIKIYSRLYEEDKQTAAFMLGLDVALLIDSKWDYYVQQQAFYINKRIVMINKMFNDEYNFKDKNDEKDFRVNKVRSILNKLYPRMDKKLLEKAGMTEKDIEEISEMMKEVYPEEVLENSFNQWWRIPKEELKKMDEKTEYIMELLFSDKRVDYVMDSCIEMISGNKRMQNAVKKQMKTYSLKEIIEVVKKSKNKNEETK